MHILHLLNNEILNCLGGITLHSAFDFKFDNNHLPLSDEKLAQFRFYLSELKLIIIDEVSLIPADMIYQIHLRLCEIFQTKAPFANKAVAMVGDLLQVIFKYISSLHYI